MVEWVTPFTKKLLETNHNAQLRHWPIVLITSSRMGETEIHYINKIYILWKLIFKNLPPTQANQQGHGLAPNFQVNIK